MLENFSAPPVPLAQDAIEIVKTSREIATVWRRDRITSSELLASLFKNAQANPNNPFYGQPDISDKLKAESDDFYGLGVKRPFTRGATTIVKRWVRDAQFVAEGVGAEKATTKHLGIAILKDEAKREELGADNILGRFNLSPTKILEEITN